MIKKVKCFVCESEFKCEKGSEMDQLGFCFLCLIKGSVTVVNVKGKTIKRKPISKEKQEEMLRRIEKYCEEKKEKIKKKETLSDKSISKEETKKGKWYYEEENVKEYLKEALIIIGNPHLKDIHKEQKIKEMFGDKLI